MKKKIVALTLFALMLAASHASAAIKVYDAFLTGLGENPPNASPGTGFGQVVLNDVTMQITVDENWSGLTAPATASHIHGYAGVGSNAPVLFPFSGVPNATAGAIPTQSFSVSAADITAFDNGLMYFNVHTSTFPGGEIRAQALRVVPEPATLALVALAGGGCFLRRRRS